jgi:nucleoside-diphosphate-sugar epimerase
MKIAVTGANGFLGSHVVERLLARGDEPVAVVRPTADLKWLHPLDIQVVRTPLDDPDALGRGLDGAEAVVHLAGATRARPLARFFDINVGLTRAVLDACAGAARPPRRVVLSSSLAATGPASSRAPLTESQPSFPVGAYGRSKYDAEQVLLGDRRVEGVVLRPPGIYGPRDVDVLQMLQLARHGIFVRTGHRALLYNWLFATDAAEAFVCACHAPAASQESFNVGDDTNYTSAEFDQIVAQAVSAPRHRTVHLPGFAIKAVALAGELATVTRPRPPTLNWDKAKIVTAGSWALDNAKARELLGWRPAFTTAEGMAATVAWYRERGWLT